MAWTLPTTRATGHVLTASQYTTDVTDNIAWLGAAKPRARVFNSAAISITTSGAAQVLTFDSERYDIGGCHSTVTNTGRLTVPTGGAGLYQIGVSVGFASNATGYRQLSLRVNGTTLIGVTLLSATATGAHYQQVVADYVLSAADYVEVLATQTSGGALNVLQAASYTPEFWFRWVATSS